MDRRDPGPGQRRSIRVPAGPGRQEQECPPGYPAHRPGGCNAPGAASHQRELIRFCQPGRPALPWNLNQPFAPGACAPKIEGKRRALFPADFVLHSLRHTMLTRLGESGVDAFTIMRIAGHSSIVVSQRYIHPTPEAVERAFERLQLSGDFAENGPKRLPPATVSATVAGSVAVSH
ncbi:MAG: tyrosine-type recombinase/integrase [Silvibacterium sp.]